MGYPSICIWGMRRTLRTRPNNCTFLQRRYTCVFVHLRYLSLSLPSSCRELDNVGERKWKRSCAEFAIREPWNCGNCTPSSLRDIYNDNLAHWTFALSFLQTSLYELHDTKLIIPSPTVSQEINAASYQDLS